MEERTRLQKVILAILAVMVVVFGVLLAFNRSQPGIVFREEFLKQQLTGEKTVFSGNCKGKNLTITVTPAEKGTTVAFVADGWEHSYVVSEWEGNQHSLPLRKPVTVADEEGHILFRGYLADAGYLLDENGELNISGLINVSVGNAQTDLWRNYEPSMLKVAQLGTEPEIVCRGHIGIYLVMLFVTAMLALDILYPELFFQLKHWMSVRDPEPSDFYIAVQRIGWVVCPFFLAIGYYMAATTIG